MTDAEETCPRPPIEIPPSSDLGDEPAPPPPDSAESSPRPQPKVDQEIILTH